MTNKITYYHPNALFKRLNTFIDHASDSIACYCNDPVSNFTRNRKLPAATLIRLILNFSSHSLPSEISNFFTSSSSDIPSSSAVSQRRKLLDPSVFKDINYAFLGSIDNYRTFKGYHILAQDGSDINLPFLDDDTQISYGHDKPVCQFHLNALYDCLNHVYFDYAVNRPTKRSECDALVDIIDRHNFPNHSIIIADRGYESYNLIAHCIENNQKFIFRVKDIDTKNGIMTSLNLKDEPIDKTFTRILTNMQTKEIKEDTSNTYVFVPSTSTFDYLNALTRTYSLSFRVIRFKITETSYETLVTNLGEDEFKLNEFKDLYHMRWEEETGFGHLKSNVGIEYFHSKKRTFIEQEIYASIILYNFTQLIINNIEIHDEKKKKGNKYKQKIAVGPAITNVRSYLRGIIDSNVLIRNIIKNLTLIRPDRSYQRSASKHHPKTLNHRIC